MSEEVKVRMSIPMFEVGELETFDNNIHSIVEEYSKLMFKEKDQILTQRIIMKQEEEIERLEKRNKEIYEGFMATTEELCEATKEIERLNKGLDELEELCKTKYYEKNTTDIDSIAIAGNLYVYMYKKIKELKGE